ADFLDRIDDNDMTAAAADVHQCPHQSRVIRGRVAADQEKQVGALHVFQTNGGRARSDGSCEPHAAGLVTVVGAVVDIVGAVQTSEKLQQKARLVRRAPARVEEALLRSTDLQLIGYTLQSFVPIDDAIMPILRSGKKGRRQSSAPFQLARREG